MTDEAPLQDSAAPDEGWIEVGSSDDFAEGSGWPVAACGTTVAVIRFEGRLYGLHDLCTHGAAQLSTGWVEDGWVECPLHQGRFDVRDGRPLCDPATAPVRVYPVRVEAGRVFIGVDAG